LWVCGRHISEVLAKGCTIGPPWKPKHEVPPDSAQLEYAELRGGLFTHADGTSTPDDSSTPRGTSTAGSSTEPGSDATPPGSSSTSSASSTASTPDCHAWFQTTVGSQPVASQPPSQLHHSTIHGQSYCNQGPGQFASPPAAPAETTAHARAPAQSFAAFLPTNLSLPAEQPSHIAYQAYQASHADQLSPAEQPSPTDQPLPADQPSRAVQTPFPIGQRSLGESGGEGCPDRSDGRSSNQRSSPGNAGTGGHRGGDGNSRSEGAQTSGSAQELMEPPIRVGARRSHVQVSKIVVRVWGQLPGSCQQQRSSKSSLQAARPHIPLTVPSFVHIIYL